jgi:renalase
MVEGAASSAPQAAAATGEVAVIGAGISGLACARALVDSGITCSVFEKSRGRGGRAATRRMGEHWFDHGAPSFTARDPKFIALVEAWLAVGHVQEWTGPVEVGRPLQPKAGDLRLVAVPGMSTLARLVGGGVPCTTTTKIAAVGQTTAGWRLTADDGRVFGPFGAVVISAPAPQAAALLAAAPKLAERAAAVEFAPCWTVLVEFSAPVALAAGAHPSRGKALAWAVHEASRPGRPPGERWVLHANALWSVAHLGESESAVVSTILTAFAVHLDRPLPPVTFSTAHRWLHAVPKYPLRTDCLWDAWTRIGACGDWCSTGDVEGAWRSGRSLATLIRATLR